MYKSENNLYKRLCYLKHNYHIKGIKAEFEAEGSSLRDLIRLRRLTLQANIKLYLKIGGVEAIRDIQDAIEIGVDGIIAPMVESKFGAKKFYDSIKKIYEDEKIHTTLNIETKNGIENFDEILDFAKNRFDNITIGRTDLTASYFNQNVKPNDKFIFKIIEKIAYKVNKTNLTFTVGGSISTKTIKKLNTKYRHLQNNINNLETRKAILDTNKLINTKDSLKEILEFEKLYILSKKEFNDKYIKSDLQRLTKLKKRI